MEVEHMKNKADLWSGYFFSTLTTSGKKISDGTMVVVFDSLLFCLEHICIHQPIKHIRTIGIHYFVFCDFHIQKWNTIKAMISLRIPLIVGFSFLVAPSPCSVLFTLL